MQCPGAFRHAVNVLMVVVVLILQIGRFEIEDADAQLFFNQSVGFQRFGQKSDKFLILNGRFPVIVEFADGRDAADQDEQRSGKCRDLIEIPAFPEKERKEDIRDQSNPAEGGTAPRKENQLTSRTKKIITGATARISPTTRPGTGLFI